LQQVVFNLCTNAAQAMDGAGRIDIRADVCDVFSPRRVSQGDLGSGRYVRITVSDTGRGMDGATLRRIFEPFFTTRSAGNGLGLATVREIVGDHGGAMDVQSTPGVGSRFEIWLPWRAMTTSAVVQDPRPLPLGRGETVLLIDNERKHLLQYEEIIAALGYEAVGFADGDDALTACRQSPERFDILVVGRVMSAASAFALAVALHRIAPAQPILLGTTSANEIDAEELVAAGISDVVRWPIGAAEMAAALERCASMIRAGGNV
jgi:CheY-like chemotaxis protein